MVATQRWGSAGRYGMRAIYFLPLVRPKDRDRRRCLFIAIADVDHLGHFGKILHAFAGALVQLARNDD